MKVTKSNIILVIMLSLVTIGMTVQTLPFTTNIDPVKEVIISFEPAQSNTVLGKLASYGVNIIEKYNIISAVAVTLPSSLVNVVSQIPGVKYVEDNAHYTKDITPNDPRFSELWGMSRIKAPQAWDLTTGSSSVLVAVIDEGIDINHPDLAANIWTNPGEIPNNGIDDDNNGYIDDINGWNFLDKNNLVYGGDPTKDTHGTHVAGTIGAVGNNGIGVVGVNWNVKIMSLKFLGATGGSTTDAISAVQYASAMGVKIISASWGGGPYNQALKDAIDAFPGLFVAAAGNSAADNDATPHYPSSYTSTNLISVASSTSTDGMSSFSNYGATSVDIAAPGSNILSTYPGNSYNTISGTSMATPHVSGAAALLLARDPTLTTAQLKQKLIDGVDVVPAFQGKVVSNGILNVYKSMTGSTPPPSSTKTSTFTGTVSSTTVDQVHYFDLTATGTISATLSWPAGPDVDMYLYAPGVNVYGTGYVTRAYTTANPETLSYSATITGTWAIRVNYYSGSSASYTLSVTYPVSGTVDTTPPAQVTGLTANAVSTSQINLAWNANTEPDLANYKIYRGGILLTSTTVTSYSDTGLASGTSYSYQVSAVDTSTNEGLKSTTATATTLTPSDTTPPSVTIVTPTGTVSGTVVVEATITDNIGVSSADYRIDTGVWVALIKGTGSSWTANLDTTTLTDANHTIEVRGLDAAANTGTATGTFTVSNTPPSTPGKYTFTGTVSSTSPDQVFYFNVTTTGTISATLSWPAGPDVDMYLYAPGANVYGTGYVTRAYTTANPETLSYSATTTGKWAIRVNYYSGASASFTLDVTVPVPSTTKTSTFTGIVSSATVDQVYYFDLTATGTISATLSWPAGPDVDMYLYAPGVNVYGTGYATRAYTTANPETLSFSATTTGTWAIRVNYYSGASASFTLSVTYPVAAATPANVGSVYGTSSITAQLPSGSFGSDMVGTYSPAVIWNYI